MIKVAMYHKQRIWRLFLPKECPNQIHSQRFPVEEEESSGQIESTAFLAKGVEKKGKKTKKKHWSAFPDTLKERNVSEPDNFWSRKCKKNLVQHQDPGVELLIFSPHKIKIYCLVLSHRSDNGEF